MKKALFPYLLIPALAACSPNSSQDTAAAVGPAARPDANAQSRFESTPLVVVSSSVATQPKEVLGGATWTAKQCALTTQDDGKELVAEASGATRMSGFFIAPDDRPAGDFDIVLVGEPTDYKIPSRTGWDRSDVGEYFHIPELAASGFELDVDLSSVPPGEYKVDFLLHRGGERYFCESGKNLVIRP